MLRNVRAYMYGVRDGWRQPYDLSSSRNIEHLAGYDWHVQNVMDRGINHGQLLRAGRHSQYWTEYRND